MEKEILNLLGFKLNSPNAMHFLRIYVELLKIPKEVTTVAMVRSENRNKDESLKKYVISKQFPSSSSLN